MAYDFKNLNEVPVQEKPTDLITLLREVIVYVS